MFAILVMARVDRDIRILLGYCYDAVDVQPAYLQINLNYKLIPNVDLVPLLMIFYDEGTRLTPNYLMYHNV